MGEGEEEERVIDEEDDDCEEDSILGHKTEFLTRKIDGLHDSLARTGWAWQTNQKYLLFINIGHLILNVGTTIRKVVTLYL